MSNTQTLGQIRDTISKKVTKFYVQALGVGPHETKTYIVEDMIIIRLSGKLLPIEQRLLEGTQGVHLVKDIRKTLHEITTKRISSIIKKVTGHSVISSHSDISTKTGERIEIYILDINYEKDIINSNRNTAETVYSS